MCNINQRSSSSSYSSSCTSSSSLSMLNMGVKGFTLIVMVMFMVLVFIPQSVDSTYIVGYTFSSNVFTPYNNLFITTTFNETIQTGSVDITFQFLVNGNNVVFLPPLQNQSYGSPTLKSYTFGPLPIARIPQAITGPNTFRLDQVGGSFITMNSLDINAVPGLNATKTLTIIDTESPVVNGINLLEYTNGSYYTFGDTCNIKIGVLATDNYYGVNYIQLGNNGVNTLELFSGTRLDGYFIADVPIAVATGTPITQYTVYDGMMNENVVNSIPIYCNQATSSMITNSSLVGQLSGVDLISDTVYGPTGIMLLEYAQYDTKPFQFTNINSVSSVPFASIGSGTGSELLLYRQRLDGVPQKTISVKPGDTSTLSQDYYVVFEVPTAATPEPSVTGIKLTQISATSQYIYSNSPLSSDSILMVLEFTASNPQNITMVMIKDMAAPGSVVLFADNNIVSSMNGTDYVQFVNISLLVTRIQSTTLVFYYSTLTQEYQVQFTANITLPIYINNNVVSQDKYLKITYNNTLVGGDLEVQATYTVPNIINSNITGGVVLPSLDTQINLGLLYGSSHMVVQQPFPYGYTAIDKDKMVIETYQVLSKSVSGYYSSSLQLYQTKYQSKGFVSTTSDQIIMDTTNPTILSIQQNRGNLTIRVFDSQSGVAFCQVQNPQTGYIVILGANNIISSVSKQQIDFSVPLNQVNANCQTMISVTCYDRSQNQVQYQGYGLNLNATQSPSIGSVQCPKLEFVPVYVRAKHQSLDLVDFTVQFWTLYDNTTFVTVVLTSTGDESVKYRIPLTDSNTGSSLRSSGVKGWVVPSALSKPTYFTISIEFSCVSATDSNTVKYSKLQLDELLFGLGSPTNDTNNFSSYLSSTSLKLSPSVITDRMAPLVTSIQVDYITLNNSLGVVVNTTEPSGVGSIQFTYLTSLDPKPTTTSFSFTGVNELVSFNIPLDSNLKQCQSYTVYYYIQEICDLVGNCINYNYYDFPQPLVIDQVATVTSPVISVDSFDFTPKKIYSLSSLDQDRTIQFTMKVSRSNSPSTHYQPTVYISDSHPWVLNSNISNQVQLTPTSTIGNTQTYTGSITLPRYYGLDGLSMSVYGVGDQCGNFIGLSQHTLSSQLNVTKLVALSCSGNCSGNGDCINGVCKCDSGYSGDNCEIRNTCIDPSNQSICNGRGTCLLSGFCSCTTRRYTGAYCNEYLSVYPPYNITFEVDSPWCLYSINGTYSNITDSKSYQNNSTQFKFDIKLYSVVEYDIYNNVVRIELLKEMQRVGTPLHFTMYKTLADGSQLNSTMIIANSSTSVEWMDETISLPRNTVKYTLKIKDYQYKDKLNYLVVYWNVTSSTNYVELSSVSNDCSSSTTDENANLVFGGTKDAFSFIQWPFMNYQLFARFPTRGMVDGRKFDVVNRWVNTTKLSSQSNSYQVILATNIPHATSVIEIDPDFSTLVRVYDENEDGGDQDCGEDHSAKIRRQIHIIIGVVVGVIGMAALVLVAMQVIKRLGRSSNAIWFRKTSLRLSSKMSHGSRTSRSTPDFELPYYSSASMSSMGGDNNLEFKSLGNK